MCELVRVTATNDLRKKNGTRKSKDKTFVEKKSTNSYTMLLHILFAPNVIKGERE